MSRFLAPIHNWLFGKIKIHEELESNLVNAFVEKYGEDIKNIEAEAHMKYGKPMEDKPLEVLIDTSNIHGWLQNRIDIAETRQSSILTNIMKKYGEEAGKIAFDVFSAQGSEYGRDSAEKFDVSSARKIYDALNNYILEGMPCDNVNNISYKSEDKLIWENRRCLHRPYWEKSGADTELFYNLRHTWIKNFVESANENFTFQEKTEERDGVKFFVHEIIKK
jgi:hypothetical protein